MRNNHTKFSWYGLFNDEEYQDKKVIKDIKVIPADANICNVYYDGYYVYAKQKFYPGDIIEICPTKEISKSSLYSRDIRDIVFEIEAGERYVIPFGYCQFYQVDAENGKTANCDYIWDPNIKSIIIKALQKIDMGEKLVLNTI